MRILVVAESFLPAMHGVTRSVLAVVGELGSRHELRIVAPGPGVDQVGGVPIDRLPSWPFPGTPELSVARPTRRVAALVEQVRPDVVYAAAPVVIGRAALRAARAWGIPTVAVHQTDLVGFCPHYRLGALAPVAASWLRRTYGLADLVLAPSQTSCEALAALGVRQVRRWPRGVDLDAFAPRWRNDELRRAWAPRGEVVVGALGRLAPEKRLDLLAGIDRFPGTRLVVVGDGPERHRLERLLPAAVFTGRLEGVALSRAVASFDVLVHAGTEETFCQAVQEALAAGVPVLAPAAGGPLDLVQHGRNGLLHHPGSDEDLRRDVRLLVGDPVYRARLGAAARDSVAARSWQAVCGDLERWLEDLAPAGAEHSHRGSDGTARGHAA